jgi:hypothetical protein
MRRTSPDLTLTTENAAGLVAGGTVKDGTQMKVKALVPSWYNGKCYRAGESFVIEERSVFDYLNGAGKIEELKENEKPAVQAPEKKAPKK